MEFADALGRFGDGGEPGEISFSLYMYIHCILMAEAGVQVSVATPGGMPGRFRLLKLAEIETLRLWTPTGLRERKITGQPTCPAGARHWRSLGGS